MEKTISFAVFKEKIIKTNELLNLVLERNNALKKAQTWNQHLKTRLELSKNEINKLKLKNKTITCNFTTAEKSLSELKSNHEDLKQEFSKFKDESDHLVNTLQINYQSANQELEECKERLSLLDTKDDSEEDEEPKGRKRRKRSPQKKKSPKNKRSPSKEETFSRGYIVLQAEKEKLASEKCDLQLEIYELKQQVKTLTSKTDAEDGVMQQDLSALKETVESKDKEINRLLKEIKNIEKERNMFQQENERLKMENILFQQEISQFESNKVDSLQKRLNDLNSTIKDKNETIDQLTLKTKTLTVERNKLQIEISNLRKEHSLCQQVANSQDKQELSLPCIEEKNSEEAENTDLGNAATLMVPLQTRRISATPTDEEVCAIMEHMAVPERVSPLSIEGIDVERRISPFKSKSLNPPVSRETNTDLQTLVNRRRLLTKRRKRLARSKLQHVDLYGTLLALKRANIHFLISNKTLLRPVRDSPSLTNPCYPKTKKYKHFEKERTKTFMKELDCQFSSCKTSYMVLEEAGKDKGVQLLGFVDVKDEDKAHRKSDMGQQVDRNFDTLKCPQRRNSVDTATDVEVIECDLPVTEMETDVTVQNLGQTTLPDKILQVEPNTKRPRGRPRINKRSPQKSVIKKKMDSKNKNLDLNTSLDIYEEESPPACTTVSSDSGSNDDHSTKSRDFVFKKPLPKSPKTTFKRPVCRTRHSLRLVSAKEKQTTEHMEEECNVENTSLESPKSPTPECESEPSNTPVLIPLERESVSNEDVSESPETVNTITEPTEKMPPSKIETLFNKLIIYSNDEEALNDVVREFSSQEPDYIAEAVLERVALDYHDKADTKYSPAPLMTHVQRTMLGFMSKLEKSNVSGVFDNYLTLAEQRLLTCNSLQEFGPITRLYLAVCKLQKKLSRMRKLCCDVFYFCGDLAVPFFFTVLTSWTEVLPHAADAKDFPIARVFVQTIYTRDCNKPGYNFMALRDLLIKFYGYPSERWDHNEFFKELFDAYLRNPSRSSDFALLLYCRNQPEKWVYEKIDEHFKPLINMKIQDNFKATLIILVGNLYNRFSSKSELNYLPKIREWLSGLVTDDTPDVVKRCVYVSLNRLKKK